MVNDNVFSPVRDNSGKIVGLNAVSGDYNADGNNNDLPNQTAGLPHKFSRKNFLGANLYKPVLTAQPIAALLNYAPGAAINFTNPALGQEGNAPLDYFKNPDYTDTDVTFIKNNPIPVYNREVNLQLKLEVFNAPNRVELCGINNNVGSNQFATVQNQCLQPRTAQLGAHIEF
jgi:hypothetical protein